MHPTPLLLDLPATDVIGLSIETVPRSPEIPALWSRLIPRMADIAPDAFNRESYGLMQHLPRGGAASTDRLHYLAGVRSPPHEPVPEGMTREVIPAGTYAVFRWPFADLPGGFDWIFTRWLPAAPWSLRPGPYFERYAADFDPANPAAEIEIALPVRAGHLSL